MAVIQNRTLTLTLSQGEREQKRLSQRESGKVRLPHGERGQERLSA